MIIPNTPESWEQAASVIAVGGVIAFRTDTFYGLGADPLNKDAVRAIRGLKGREEAKPILLLISDRDQTDRFIKDKSDAFVGLARRFWPGPLTIVGVAREELHEELTAGTGTIGIRLPADEAVRSLVRACGGALTATSANLASSEPARNAAQVANYFPAGIELIIDAGDVSATRPSTVVDATGARLHLIREGAITRVELEKRDPQLT